MLIRAKVENFKSYDEMTDLTMISSNKTRDHVEHKVNIKNISLLKYGVIYGANASGKSNLVQFFKFFKTCVFNTIPAFSKNMFCKNKERNIDRESEFEIQFTIGNKFYAYGFCALLNKLEFTSEWLYELLPNGKASCVFERDKDGIVLLGGKFKLSKEDRIRLDVYLRDFKERTDLLFLKFINSDKYISSGSKLNIFKDVYDWITTNIFIITPTTRFNDLSFYESESLNRVNELIQIFDTGISEVKIVDISLEELRNLVPEFFYRELVKELEDRKNEGRSSFVMAVRSRDFYFSIRVEENQEPKISTIKLNHTTSFYDFDFYEESNGTRRLFDLMDLLLNKQEDVLYVIDEIETSLHPKLTKQFLEMFMKIHLGKKVQLLFTTHESALMDENLFRRDEIWFVEKSYNNISSIYSLGKFNERYDRKLSKAYLDGRYGAIPYFKSYENYDQE